MSGKAHRWLSALVMITAASGCDNVDWGGAEVRLVPPPSNAPDTVAAGDSVPAEPDLGLPEGPVLYTGSRRGDRVTVVPVAEIRGDSLRPIDPDANEDYVAAFTEDHLRQGTEFILFAGGVRVGRTLADSVGTDDSFCTPRPSAAGTVELLPSAAAVERFLALSADQAAARPFGTYEALEHTYPQRAASVQYEIDLLRRTGARFPSGDLVNSRVAMTALRLGQGGPDAFAATFVNLDAPRITPADSAAWSSFILGVASGDAYRPAYTWQRSVASDGKGVPLYWGQMDWDGDGEPEVLLEVLGARSRWTAAVARRGGQWERIFQDPCGTPSPDDGGG